MFGPVTVRRTLHKWPGRAWSRYNLAEQPHKHANTPKHSLTGATKATNPCLPRSLAFSLLGSQLGFPNIAKAAQDHGLSDTQSVDDKAKGQAKTWARPWRTLVLLVLWIALWKPQAIPGLCRQSRRPHRGCPPPCQTCRTHPKHRTWVSHSRAECEWGAARFVARGNGT